MPKAHRAHLEWSPSRLIGRGAPIGRHTEALVQALLESRPHPEQGYRSCLGILRLAKQHGPERLDACQRARTGLLRTSGDRRRPPMLTEPTLDRLRALRLGAMADAYRAQRQEPAIGALSFDERVGLLVEAEHLLRDNRKLARRLPLSTRCMRRSLTTAHPSTAFRPCFKI
jgi:hypothetical protein